MSTQSIIEAFFDEPTNTISYLVADPATRDAAVIDPVLDFDPTWRDDARRKSQDALGRTHVGFAARQIEIQHRVDHRGVARHGIGDEVADGIGRLVEERFDDRQGGHLLAPLMALDNV